MAKYLGFNYPGKNYYIKGNHDPAQVLRNCVHPIEGKHIFDIARGIYNHNNNKQGELFS
jgi:DNA (cytosine-5)-methyltransferase 1